MGIVEKILSKSKTDPESVISTNDISIELSENFHLHYRNSRFELDHEEWKKISKNIIISYIKWLILFRPKSGDIDNTGKQIFLSKSKVSSILRSDFEGVFPQVDALRNLDSVLDSASIQWNHAKLVLHWDWCSNCHSANSDVRPMCACMHHVCNNHHCHRIKQ